MSVFFGHNFDLMQIMLVMSRYTLVVQRLVAAACSLSSGLAVGCFRAPAFSLDS